jgi:ribonuclease HI
MVSIIWILIDSANECSQVINMRHISSWFHPVVKQSRLERESLIRRGKIAKVRRKLFVNCDGLCEPVNPAGIACYGFVVKKEKDMLLYREYGLVNSVRPFSPETNNNTAEYGSAIRAMEWLVENGYANDSGDCEILIRGDCQPIMRKLKSINYSPRAARLNSLYDRAVMLRAKFGPDSIVFEWINRDQNMEADNLAKKAYYWALRKYPKLQKRVREHWAAMLWLEQRKYSDPVVMELKQEIRQIRADTTTT